ncbi:MAG: amidohydrolase family protein, partial [Candidatus Cloacimonadota bacterium]|nr:amidohydrolase family protein [Candidatus Cloacimonadota bacterium]
MNKIDLIIENGLILPINPQNQIIKNGFIVINKNKIIQIGSKKPTKYFSDNTIDANGGIIMPGLINAHTHIAMTYFRGLADDLALDKWLQEYIWPAESKYLNKDFVYQSSIHGCAELIRNGTTYFNDMYFWGNEIAQAAIKTGIKTTIGEGILNQPIGENKTPKDIINYVLNLIEKYKNNSDIDFSIAPHSIFTCSKDTLKLSANIAQKHNLPIHIHLSETKKEIDDCIKNYNKLPLEYLKECGILDNKVVAAHGTFLTDKELKLVSNNDFHVAVNTNCNLKLASGHTPINLFIKN